MNFSINEHHIATFHNYFNDELLDRYIKHFEFCKENTTKFSYKPEKQFQTANDNLIEFCKENKSEFTYKREKQFQTVDENVDLLTSNFYNDDNDVVVKYINAEFLGIFFNNMYSEYVKKYEILNFIKHHNIYEVKVQKTLPGEGYHIWHCENVSLEHRTRLCAFILYLNDVEEGGETEFLYQKTRIKPEKNKLLLFPANYTHIHRGNPPLSGEKYILTGWVEAV